MFLFHTPFSPHTKSEHLDFLAMTNLKHKVLRFFCRTCYIPIEFYKPLFPTITA